MSNISKNQYDQLLYHVTDSVSLSEFIKRLQRVHIAPNVTIDDCIEFLQNNESFLEVDTRKLYEFTMSLDQKMLPQFFSIIIVKPNSIDWMRGGSLVVNWHNILSDYENIHAFCATGLDKINQIL